MKERKKERKKGGRRVQRKGEKIKKKTRQEGGRKESRITTVTKDISLYNSVYTQGGKNSAKPAWFLVRRFPLTLLIFFSICPVKRFAVAILAREEGNVKGGNGVIALRPVKKRTDHYHRPEKGKEKNEIIGQPWLYDLSRKNATPKIPETRSPRSFTNNIRAKFVFLTASKGTALNLFPLNST